MDALGEQALQAPTFRKSKLLYLYCIDTEYISELKVPSLPLFYLHQSNDELKTDPFSQVFSLIESFTFLSLTRSCRGQGIGKQRGTIFSWKRVIGQKWLESMGKALVYFTGFSSGRKALVMFCVK